MYICDDCKQVTYSPVHYVLGAIRCPHCSSIFKSTNRENKIIKEHLHYKSIQEFHRQYSNDDCGLDKCQKCCAHDEHDHYICSDCGLEMESSDFYDEDYGQER